MSAVPLDLVWILVTYLSLIILDASAHYRAGLAYVVSRKNAPNNPRFWSGFKARHLVLIPIAVLAQSVIRDDKTSSLPVLIALGVLAVIYTALVAVDAMNQRRGVG